MVDEPAREPAGVEMDEAALALEAGHRHEDVLAGPERVQAEAALRGVRVALEPRGRAPLGKLEDAPGGLLGPLEVRDPTARREREAGDAARFEERPHPLARRLLGHTPTALRAVVRAAGATTRSASRRASQPPSRAAAAVRAAASTESEALGSA